MILIIMNIFCFSIGVIYSQEIPLATEQQLEELADREQADTEDDTHLLRLEQYKKHPLDINIADADELKELNMLSDLQIASFLSYRRLLGRLISIYELQAIPAWDIQMIRRLLPFIRIGAAVSMEEDMRARIKNGEHSFLFRVAQVIERSKGYIDAGNGAPYQGSPQRVYFRYRYNYKNLFQYGITGDKDAGEFFFKGKQKAGFDFYSFHLFVRKLGSIQALAIGDFTVNMGQGLIHWQGLAFKKSVEVMGTRRQSAILRPYSSAGEFNFNRGVGITIRKANMEASVFISARKISTNQEKIPGEVISSFLNSGLHRTLTENENRNNASQFSTGAAIAYRSARWHAGINIAGHNFSLPLQKRDEPYNLFSIKGRRWINSSVDYSYTYKNLHLFGEAAVDRFMNKAFINGMLISIDPRVDLSVVQRSIGKAYQSVNGNAFTENTSPTNESGWYTGIAIRPADNWRLDTYADIYGFHWLKYLVDAPSYGHDFLIQLTYTAGRKTEIYARFKNESKQGNESDNTSAANYLVKLSKQNWRIHINYKLSPSLTWRNRAELCWYDKKGNNPANGFLLYADLFIKPMPGKYSTTIRLQYFETDNYNSRMYAYENDVLYSYSVPVFYERGYRYYVILNLDIGKSLSCWIRCSQTIYTDNKTIGSGLDEINGNKKNEMKFQIRYIF